MTPEPAEPHDPQPAPRRVLSADAGPGGTPVGTPGGVPGAFRMEYVSPGTTPVRWPYDEPAGWAWPLLVVAWIAGGAGAVAGLAGLITVTISFPPVLSVPLALLLLVCLAAIVRGARRRHAAAVLGYLEQAVRLNLPLPDLLAAAALSEQGALRRTLQALRRRLETGEPIGDALARSLSGLPYRTVVMVQAAERSARLPQALRRAVEQERYGDGADPAGRRSFSVVRSDPSTAIFLRWYPLLLVTGVSAVCWVFSIFVAPKFKQILRDFGVPVPALTQFVLDAAPWLAAVVAVCAVIVLVRIAGLFGDLFMPRQVRVNPSLGVFDSVLWYLPPARGIVRSRGMADVCNTAADALEGGHTFGRALGEASTLRVNSVLSRRMRVWADLAAQGQAPADAARLAGMPPLVPGMLATARSGDGAANAMRFLARYYQGRFSRAAYMLRAAAGPVLAVIFGAMVAVVAAAQFLPMVRLMDKLAPGMSGGAM